MNQQGSYKIQSVDKLPVKTRRKTDFFCILVFSTYFVLLALICIFIHNSDNLERITYPTDNQGKLCGYDPEVKIYPYLYYTSFVDPTKRLCVNQCPLANATQLSCKPTATLGCRPNSNPKYEVSIYNTYLDEGKIGLFCLPLDNSLKQTVIKMSNAQSKYAIFSVVDAILTSGWTAVVVGIILFLLTHFWPYKTVPWIIFLGAICSFVFGIFIFTFTSGFILAKILVSAFFFFLGFISFKTLYDSDRKQSVVVCARMISVASLTHSKRNSFGQLQISINNIKNLGKPFLLILCFASIYILFFYINTKQVLSIGSAGKLVFVADKPFYGITSFASNFLMILLIIQIIWGAFLIKQSYNFIAASHSVQWYFGQEDPSFLECTELLLKYHIGSVIGGSLLQGFLYFFELFYNFFYDSQTPNKQSPKQYENSIQYDRILANESASPVKQFFDLVRGQALAYVSLVGLPYCNSARYCQLLSSSSPFYNYSQTTNRILRINMHFVPMFIILCVGMNQMGPLATPYSILIVAVLSYFIITYFLSYHGEKAEGLLISLYTDEALNDGKLQTTPNVLKQIYNDDINGKHRDITLKKLLFSQDIEISQKLNSQEAKKIQEINDNEIKKNQEFPSQRVQNNYK